MKLIDKIIGNKSFVENRATFELFKPINVLIA